MWRTAKLVAVKAEEWQRRAAKVMSQAKPQLGVVRELFEEGRELGYEELIIPGACLRCLLFLAWALPRFCLAPLCKCHHRSID